MSKSPGSNIDKPVPDASDATVISSSEPKKSGRLPQRNVLFTIGAVLALIILVLLITLVLFPPKLKTITYNNGQGYNFSIKFYRQHYISKDFTSTTPLNSQQQKPGYKYSLAGLASKISTNNQYPVWLGISVSGVGNSTQGIPQKNGVIPCTTSTLFTVDNTALKRRIPICKLDLAVNRPAYSAAFIYNQKKYFIIVTQVASEQQLANPNSKNMTALENYQTDLTAIISSIKPAP